MRVHRIAAVAAVTSFLTISTASQAGNCWRPEEARAAQLRDFQTMLVVGALKCRAQFPETLDGYNRFVVSQRALLVATNDILKARFEREEGAAGDRAYDRHHTEAANEFSSDGRMTTARGCGRIARLSMMAAQMARDELQLLADSVVPPPYSSACTAAAPAAPLVAAPAIPAATSPASVPAAEPGAPATIASSAVAASEPAPIAAPAPQAAEATAAPRAARIEFADNTASPPPALSRTEKAAASSAPASSRDDALREALVALQAATAALQAATESAAPAAVVDASLPIREVAHEGVVPLDSASN